MDVKHGARHAKDIDAEQVGAYLNLSAESGGTGTK
jgi:hypothetical protein